MIRIWGPANSDGQTETIRPLLSNARLPQIRVGLASEVATGELPSGPLRW